MPTTESIKSRGLNANIKILLYNSNEPMPELKRLWVIRGNEIWESVPAETWKGLIFDGEYSVNGGPEWDPGKRVWSVMEIKLGSQTKFIKTGDITINAVY